MKSYRTRVARCWILKMTTFAIMHNIGLFLLVGHISNCGRNIHSSGIRDGVVRSINAIRVSCYCHVLRPSPHSVNLCSSVSTVVHLWQEIEGVIFIRWSRFRFPDRPARSSVAIPTELPGPLNGTKVIW